MIASQWFYNIIAVDTSLTRTPNVIEPSVGIMRYELSHVLEGPGTKLSLIERCPYIEVYVRLVLDPSAHTFSVMRRSRTALGSRLNLNCQTV